MNGRRCAYEGNRDEQIVACLYDEPGTPERVEFDSHVATCRACSEELAALRAVRVRLGQWAPPVPSGVLVRTGSPTDDVQARRVRPRVLTLLAEVPAWAQVAAAMLFVGLAAGIANLDIRYDPQGLSVRTGWPRQAPSTDVDREGAPSAASVEGTQPWRVDLADLERQLRSEFRLGSSPPTTRQTTATQSSVSETDVVRTVRGLVEESEHRQQRELALHLAEAARDIEVQRRADLEKIDYMIRSSLGAMQSTGVEVMRQRRMINDLAVRVSGRP